MKNLSAVTEDKDIVTKELLDGKQATLVSGTNIKTVNGESLLGSGNVSIEALTADEIEDAVDAALAIASGGSND